MRTIEVIDNIQLTRGRYSRTDAGRVNDLVLAPEDGGATRGGATVGGGGDFDDDASFAGSNLGDDLERELTRRARRSAAKRCCAAAAVLCLVAALVGRRPGGWASPARGSGADRPSDAPESGGGDGDGGVAASASKGGKGHGGAKGRDDDGAGDDDPFPVLSRDDDEAAAAEAVSVEAGSAEMEDLAALFDAARAPPPYDICPPPLERDRPATQRGDAVFHMAEFRTVPEDAAAGADAAWRYSLSDMDVNRDASIVAVGMGDYAADTGYSVGLVRTFAYSCAARGFQRLGQDLLGHHDEEMFGHRVSSSGDGRIMAVSAPQRSYEGGTGFVEVFQLDEDTGKWELLGQRIDELDKAKSDYFMLGHAVDVSDRGETLAVLSIVDDDNANPSYLTRVFDYDYRKKKWLRKGKDLVIANVTFGREGDYDYSPQVSLSEKGDKLVVTDPQMGVVKYHFHFGFNRWKMEEARTPKWNDDLAADEFWISSLDLDDRGELVAFSAFEEEAEGTIVNAVKIVSFVNGTVPVDVYTRDFRGWEVEISVSVADDGSHAAFVASKMDVDDGNWWVDYEYGDDVVGALTVVTRYEGEAAWSVVGEGTEAESLGVSGSMVSLSGDGRIAAIGYDTVVSLYGIELEPIIAGAEEEAEGTSSEAEVTAPTVQESAKPQDGGEGADACVPFPGATSNGPLGYIDDLPRAKEGEEHTLSLSLSKNGSVVAVGIDSYDGEDRGLVRTFLWSCQEGRYIQLGQDLLGRHEFDGFGQSVHLSADGTALAVGANQPPPGKSGYVSVYELQGDDWVLSGQRLKDFPEEVSDIGRGVHLSSDGQILMVLGSINLDGDDSSFLRVVRKENGEWMLMGDDILSSVNFDEYGISAHATLSGDGTTLAITGSYGQFFAKLYHFDEAASKWDETVIPPPNSCTDDNRKLDQDDGWDDDDDWLDYEYECYFTGNGIAINSAADVLAVAGTSYDSSDGEIGTVRVLTKDPISGNFTTLGEDPIDFTTDYFVSSVDISDDGGHLAVGLNDHSDNLEDQGQGVSFVAPAQNTSKWVGVGKVDGTNETDLLGARVRIAGNGKLAAASSQRGYVTFFWAA